MSPGFAVTGEFYEALWQCELDIATLDFTANETRYLNMLCTTMRMRLQPFDSSQNHTLLLPPLRRTRITPPALQTKLQRLLEHLGHALTGTRRTLEVSPCSYLLRDGFSFFRRDGRCPLGAHEADLCYRRTQVDFGTDEEDGNGRDEVRDFRGPLEMERAACFSEVKD